MSSNTNRPGKTVSIRACLHQDLKAAAGEMDVDQLAGLLLEYSLNRLREGLIKISDPCAGIDGRAKG